MSTQLKEFLKAIAHEAYDGGAVDSVKVSVRVSWKNKAVVVLDDGGDGTLVDLTISLPSLPKCTEFDKYGAMITHCP